MNGQALFAVVLICLGALWLFAYFNFGDVGGDGDGDDSDDPFIEEEDENDVEISGENEGDNGDDDGDDGDDDSVVDIVVDSDVTPQSCGCQRYIFVKNRFNNWEKKCISRADDGDDSIHTIDGTCILTVTPSGHGWDNKVYHCDCPDGYTKEREAVDLGSDPMVICPDGSRTRCPPCVSADPLAPTYTTKQAANENIVENECTQHETESDCNRQADAHGSFYCLWTHPEDVVVANCPVLWPSGNIKRSECLCPGWPENLLEYELSQNLSRDAEGNSSYFTCTPVS